MKTYRAIFLCVLPLLGSACSTVRQLPSVTGSTKVEVRYRTETVPDTAYVELPVIIENRTTLDTASVLENEYAKSEAVVSAGILRHSLETKPVRKPVAVEKEIVFRDSLVFRDRVQTVTVEVEKKLTAWQTVQMRLGFVAILLLAIVVIYFIFLIINHFKS